MAWIELHQQLPAHPKTKRLARALKLSVPEDIPLVVGHLCMFWLWCVDYAIDGSLTKMQPQDIADAAGFRGEPDDFLEAMVEAEFIDRDEDAELYVHDWDDYIGKLLLFRQKERTRNRDKQARYRERKKQAEAAEAKAAQPADEETDGAAFDISGIDKEWLKVVKAYETNIGQLPYGTSADMLVSFYEDLGVDIVCKAIDITNTASPDNPWQYLRAVLNKWADQGINTIEKADAYTKDLERKLAKVKRGKGIPAENEPPAIAGDFY